MFIRGYPVQDANGNIIGAIETTLEITERRRAEEALRESEERLAAFMDSATDGFVLFDSELNYVKMNKAAQEITGVNRKEITGKNVLDIILIMTQFQKDTIMGEIPIAPEDLSNLQQTFLYHNNIIDIIIILRSL